MFDETPMNPATLAAMTETAPKKRRAASKAKAAPIAEGHPAAATQCACADGTPKPDGAAMVEPLPNKDSPAVGFRTNDAHMPAILAIRHAHRLRQRAIVANTKLVNQSKAIVRSWFNVEKFGDRDSPEAKAAEKFVDAEYKKALEDETSDLYQAIRPYTLAQIPLVDEIEHRAKVMVRELKTLPIMRFCNNTKGLGDVSLATIIAEATSINRADNEFGKAGEKFAVGDFKSVAALWKRLGVAVIDGHRQGNPGEGASKDAWVAEGYNRKRRSVLWNATNPLVLGMGKFRPMFGEDVDANPLYSPLQRLFAHRARYEALRLPNKCGTPIKESGKGKESYSKHAATRALRFTGKRMVKDLYHEWRACMG